jgi:hypothetical protein
MNWRIWPAALSFYRPVIDGDFGFIASALPRQLRPKSPLGLLTKVVYELKLAEVLCSNRRITVK